MKFRLHRETLAESMQTVVDIPATTQAVYDQLVRHWGNLASHLGTIDNLEIKPYLYDSRIGWNTYIVLVKNGGVVGFTNQNVDGKIEVVEKRFVGDII